jgi:glycosyltransferase involved in cell wall biosynthesis
MRLLFLADASLPHTQRWVNHFAARGHECVLASTERGGDYRCRVEWLPQRGSLPRFARYTFAVPRVRRLLQEFAPDVVHAHFLPNYGWLAVRAHARPLVLTALGSDILMVPQRSALHAWRTRYVLEHCDAVTSDAAMLTRAILDFEVPRERVLTVPLGIEAARFASPPAKPQAPIVILSTRRLEPVYDVGTLLHAFDRLPAGLRAGLDVRVAGDGSEAAELRRLAAGNPVQFLGWLGPARLDAELGAAHVYVSTSRSDSTSVSLLEAMAAGCFPVVSDIAANREWLEDGSTGLFFPVGDDAALAACLQRAATDAALRARAAESNRATIAARATWETNMAEVEALYRRLAPHAAEPSGRGRTG